MTGEDYQKVASCSLLHTKYFSSEQIKNEMGRACSMHRGEQRWIQQGFGGET